MEPTGPYCVSTPRLGFCVDAIGSIRRDRFFAPIGYDHLRRFLEASSKRQLTAIMTEHPDLFGITRRLPDVKNKMECTYDKMELREAQQVMHLALSVYAKATSEAISWEELEDLGITSLRIPQDVIAEVADQNAGLSQWQKDSFNDVVGPRLRKLSETEDASSEFFWTFFDMNIFSPDYSSYFIIHEAWNRGQDDCWSLENLSPEEDDSPTTGPCSRLMIDLGAFEASTHGAIDCLKSLVDALFSIHLNGMRVICVDGGTEAMKSDCALSSLWWLALDSLREGRVGLCKSCGRPFIAYRERGKKRVYCSDACKGWQHHHPGESRKAKPAR